MFTLNRHFDIFLYRQAFTRMDDVYKINYKHSHDEQQ